MSPNPPRYYGKYRGTVINNIDPMQIGRLLVQVPHVYGINNSPWAMPCLPIAGPQSGFFAVPAIGAQVWVEFEEGNSEYPIWTGGFWPNTASIPPQAQANPQSFVIETSQQTALVLSDRTGITLKSPNGATVVINNNGIILNNGQGAVISLIGPNVSIQGLKR